MPFLRSAFSFAVLLCLITQLGSMTAWAQTPTIRPEPAVGKGTVAIKAARLIDGTGKPPLNNAVVIVDVARSTSMITTIDSLTSYKCNSAGDKQVCNDGRSKLIK